VTEFRFLEIVRTLNEHGVRYVIIGGMAAILWGSDHHTNDIDVCYDRDPENLRLLVAALREMEAHLRGFPEGLPEIIDERAFKLGDTMTFTTKFGWFDCLGAPAGTRGYIQLVASATEMHIRPGITVLVASLEDIIRMKRAAGRPKDHWLVEQLKVLKQLRDDMVARGEKPAGE
jgi:predicted nucleotidyltransferase